MRPLANVLLGVSAAGLVAVAACGDRGAERRSADPAWRDRSPHTVRFVTVPGGVRLEVLDWGGPASGGAEPLVFLAGLENTGHVFDDFAPQFTDRFHVIAITRRGWGASDHPATGYTVPELVADLRAVLDSLGLARIDLVGHSIAGQEMTGLAAVDPRRVHRFVYLDAGFDYHQHRFPLPLPEPQAAPTPAESASVGAALAYYRRVSGAPLPEGDFRAVERLTPGGRDLGPATPESVSDQVVQSAESASPPLASVRAPVLAVYNYPESYRQALPWATHADSSDEPWFQLARGWYDAQRAEFVAAVPQARVVVLPGASHYVFILRGDTVAREMRAFLTAPD
jgi:non-heme chloroperoxidase